MVPQRRLGSYFYPYWVVEQNQQREEQKHDSALHAFIILRLSQPRPHRQTTKNTLLKIQNELFVIGAMLATPKEKETLKNGKERLTIFTINEDAIIYLEGKIDEMDVNLPQMTHFILPGGHQTVSFCHIARCICRRAERLVVALNDEEIIDLTIIKYLNRLSDFLFVLARKLSKDIQVEEIKWIPQKK